MLLSLFFHLFECLFSSFLLLFLLFLLSLLFLGFSGSDFIFLGLSFFIVLLFELTSSFLGFILISSTLGATPLFISTPFPLFAIPKLVSILPFIFFTCSVIFLNEFCGCFITLSNASFVSFDTFFSVLSSTLFKFLFTPFHTILYKNSSVLF